MVMQRTRVTDIGIRGASQACRVFVDRQGGGVCVVCHRSVADINRAETLLDGGNIMLFFVRSMRVLTMGKVVK